MKRLFLLVCTMLVAVLCFAQETKKVAILETVDREGKVSYAVKLILRSSLAKAITGTEGYEAYDRTDMDAILGEQNFQRTGMVSNEQIKRLGEMTGAKYVLVAEAAVVDANNMYVTAKLLDVETARTEMTDNQMMGVTPKEIQRGCQLLASNLIKPIRVATIEREPMEKEKVNRTKQRQKDDSDYEDDSEYKYERNPYANLGEITKISDNEYRLGRYKMNKKGYEKFIYKNCPEAWKKYNGGKKAIVAGWTLFSIGAASMIASSIPYVNANNEWDEFHYYVDKRDQSTNSKDWDYYQVFVIDRMNRAASLDTWGGLLVGIGSSAFTVGLITFSCGYVAKGNAYKIYNKKCADSTPITLNLKSDQNGIGLALQF